MRTLATLLSRLLGAVVWLVALSLVLLIVLLVTSSAATGPRAGSAIAGGVVVVVALVCVRALLDRLTRSRR